MVLLRLNSRRFHPLPSPPPFIFHHLPQQTNKQSLPQFRILYVNGSHTFSIHPLLSSSLFKQSLTVPFMHFYIFYFFFQSVLILNFFMTSEEKHMTGGWSSQDVNSEEIKALASRSVDKISAESNDRYRLVPVEIVSAQAQVVAGMQYKLKIVVGRSKCQKSQEIAASGKDFCGEADQNARKTYLVKVWTKPWENFEQISYEPEE